MATWKFRGLDTYLAKLESLSYNSEDYVKRAIYKGAGVVADQISGALSGIQTADPDHYYHKGEVQPGPKPDEKAAIIGAFGLARMKQEGSAITTKAGFGNGTYNGTKITTLARRLESGTSWQRKQPVIRQAANRSKAAAEEAMRVELEKQIREIMN